MKEADHKYNAPAMSTEMPAALARYLDGTDLVNKTQALRLTTVDAEGWPHAALLSAGDALVIPSGRIRFFLFPQSGMAANLEREGRLTITLSLDKGMCEVRLRCRRLVHKSADIPLALFEAEVQSVRNHVAPYADVTGGVTFLLHDPEAVLPRWQRQIAALRAA